jgi:hypothetical protein
MAFPLAITPHPTHTDRPISEKVSAIKELVAQGSIRDLLDIHGAIYFKDLC